MDAIFGTKKTFDSWEWLRNQNERFMDGYMLLDNDEIEGLRKIDAIAEINKLVTTNNDFSSEEAHYIGYYDKENKRIWVLSPLKMAMLLHKYDEVEKLLNKGHTFNEQVNDDSVYIIYVIGEPNPGVVGFGGVWSLDKGACDTFGASNEYHHVPVTGLDMIFADENIPLELAAKLLNEYIATTRNICIDTAIQVNAVNERINPKWIMKLYDICQDKKFILNALTSYAFARYSAFSSDLNAYDELGKVTWSKHIYNYKVRLQIQLDVAKIMLASKEGEKLQKGIIRDCCCVSNSIEINQYNLPVRNCNKRYTIEQINCLIKQRKRLIEICKDTPNVYRAACLKGLAEAVSLNTNLIDFNADNTLENEEKYKDIGKAIETYEQMIKPHISIEWTDREIQSCLQNLLKDMNSMEGMMLVDSICELRKSKLTFSTNLDIMFAVNKWLEHIIHLPQPFLNQNGFLPLGASSDDEIERKQNSHMVATMTSETLSNIRWTLKGTWATSKDCYLKSDFYKNLCLIDNETLYRTLYKTDLLVGEVIGEVIDQLLDYNKLENVPYLFALKGTK